ncbi:MAG: hypothetical protein ABH884_02930 [Candidatus Komeilibacteria bacterium]
MLNDSGFSRIITAIVIILVLIIVGLWLGVKYWQKELVIEQALSNEQEDITAPSLPTVFTFNPEGWQINQYDLNTLEKVEIFSAEEKQLYSILTKQSNQSTLLVTTRYDANIKHSAQTLFLVDVMTGLSEEVFTLPNVEVGDGDVRYLASAQYNLDQSKIAYATILTNGENNTGLEVWEYDLVKDLHILISKIGGGTMDMVDIVGYSSDEEYLVVYQYSNDGSLVDIGQVKLIDLNSKEINNNIWQQAIARYFDLDVDQQVINTIGQPLMSPNGEAMIFTVPYDYYAQQYPDYFDKANRDELVVYHLSTHELEQVYLYHGGPIDLNQSVVSYGYWSGQDYYFPTIDSLNKYSLQTDRVQVVMTWPTDLISEGGNINLLLNIEGSNLLFTIPERVSIYYLDLAIGQASIFSFGQVGSEFYYYINQK